MDPTNPHHPETAAWAIWEMGAALVRARTAAALVVERCQDARLTELAKAHRLADVRLMELMIELEIHP